MIFFIRNLSEGPVFFYSTTGKKTIRFLFGSLFITYHQFHKGVSPEQVPYNFTPAYSLKLHRLLNPRQSLQVRTAVLPNKDSTPFKEKLQSFQAKTGRTTKVYQPFSYSYLQQNLLLSSRPIYKRKDYSKAKRQ